MPATICGSGGRNRNNVSRFFFQASWELDHADPVFYCAKASRKERDAGLEEWEAKSPKGHSNWIAECNVCGCSFAENSKPKCGHDDYSWTTGKPRRNTHPTIKPLALAKWLATLLLPPPEYAPRRITIPFMGSGSECIGAGLVGWEEIVGIDSDEEAVAIAEARIAHWLKQPQQLELA